MDNDNLIEYILQSSSTGTPAISRVSVLKENGSVLFYRDSVSLSAQIGSIDPEAFSNYHIVLFDGTSAVMKLQTYTIGTLFYSLPGSIPCVQCSSTGTTVGRPSYNNPNPDPIFYPNPATSSVKLKYQLPKDY